MSKIRKISEAFEKQFQRSEIFENVEKLINDSESQRNRNPQWWRSFQGSDLFPVTSSVTWTEISKCTAVLSFASRFSYANNCWRGRIR